MLPAYVTELIGKEETPPVMEVEKGAIRRYADAVGDRNLLYWDEEYASKSRFGAIVAPPGFFGWPEAWHGAMPMASELIHELIATVARAGYPNVLAGGQDFEFFRPVRAGDVLRSISRIADINEREGKSGKMVLSTVETAYTNQHSQLVATVRLGIIQR